MWLTELGTVFTQIRGFEAWLEHYPSETEPLKQEEIGRKLHALRVEAEDPCLLDYIQLWLESNDEFILELGTFENLLLAIILIADSWAESDGMSFLWSTFADSREKNPRHVSRLGNWRHFFPAVDGDGVDDFERIGEETAHPLLDSRRFREAHRLAELRQRERNA